MSWTLWIVSISFFPGILAKPDEKQIEYEEPLTDAVSIYTFRYQFSLCSCIFIYLWYLSRRWCFAGFTYQYGTQDLNFLLWFDLTNHDLLNFQQTTAYPLQNYACSVDVSDLGEEPRDVGLIMVGTVCRILRVRVMSRAMW